MIRDESGRFTLEGTLIFPILIIVTFCCLIVSISAAKHVGLATEATAAANRATFVWNNSSKNPITGAYYPSYYDDLYWRLFEDHSEAALVSKKLSNVRAQISGIDDSEALFTNKWIQRIVHIQVHAPFLVPAFVAELYGSRQLDGHAYSSVSEPVDFIRQVKLARDYWPMIKNTFSTEETDNIIDDFRKRPGLSGNEQLVFHSHNEARAYLQKLVHGQKSTRLTEKVGEWRLIDALDANGVAHQAYFGHKTLDSDMRDQLLKDVEILGRGQVNGVVWHFFKRGRDGSVGLSSNLRKQLEARGIVVVVHE